MSTEAQVAQVMAPFVDRHPEFVRVGRSFVRSPVRHLQTGFELQRQASRGSVYPIWFAGITFGPPPHFGVGVGQAVQRAVGYLGDPDIQERLLTELEDANVAFLDRFASLDLLLEPEAVGYTGLPMMRFIRALILAALGRLGEADELLVADISHRQAIYDHVATRKTGFKSGSKAWRSEMEDQRVRASFISELRHVHSPIAQGDKAGLAIVLHDWERRGSVARKIEHLWEASPFPFELGAGD